MVRPTLGLHLDLPRQSLCSSILWIIFKRGHLFSEEINYFNYLLSIAFSDLNPKGTFAIDIARKHCKHGSHYKALSNNGIQI